MTASVQTRPPEVDAALDSDALEDALAALSARPVAGDAAAELRSLLARADECYEADEFEETAVKLERARALAESPAFGNADRAAVFFRLGRSRLALGAVANAVELLSVALDLANRSPVASDRLRSDILCWRTRCYRRQRDWEAARADSDAALELAERLGDPVRLGDAYMQSSQVAERTGQLLIACFYVERAVAIFRDGGDVIGAGRALNNLGGILFLLGRHDDAVARLQEAFAIALDLDQAVDAGYAVSSTAQVLLRGGDAGAAEHHARHALELLGGREEHVNEIGSAQLVRGRALMELDRLDDAERALDEADDCFRRMNSNGHRAAAWLAQGDLATRRGLVGDAATVYRRAAEILQDVRF